MEYLDFGGTWIEIDRINSSTAATAPGAILTNNVTLTAADALYDGLQIRFRQENGTPGEDFWHLDDVSATVE